MRTPTQLLSLLALATLPLAACSADTAKDSSDKDPKTDDPSDPGDNERARTSGTVTGEASAAVMVRGQIVNSDGTTTPDSDAESDVNADGSFTLDVAAGQELYLVQAYDASGELIGSAMLESTGSADSDTTCTPIDAESTVEAMAWLQAVAEAGDKSAASYGDVRGRIDASLAATVYSNWRDGNGQEDFDALAAAITAAQAVEVMSYGESGGETSSRAIALAELDLSSQLSSELDAWVRAGNDSTAEATDANAAFLNSLYATATTEFGLDAEAENEANSNAGLAFAAVVESMTESSSDTAEGAWVSWGELQAYLTANATADLYLAAGVSSEAQAEVEAAGSVLTEEADDAGSSGVMQDAWAQFYAQTTASTDSSLASTLQISVIEEAAYELALEDSRDAREDMMTSARAAVAAETASGFSYGSSGSAEVVAQAVLDARSTYEQDVWDACLGLESLSTADLEWMSSAVATVDGAYSFSR